MLMSNEFWRYVTPIAYRFRGDRSYVYLSELISSEKWTREQHLELQLRKLRELLAHCEAEVPYYREMFQEIGFKPEHVRSLRDLLVLPILTKDIVRREGGRMIARNYKDRLLIHHTGGSTGVPLTFFRHKEYEELGYAGVLRNFRECGWKVGEPIAQFWGFGKAQLDAGAFITEIKASVSRLYRFNAFDVSSEGVTRWCERLSRVRPTVLFGYASTIYLFARQVHESGLSLHGIKGIFSTAEPLYDFQREFIQQVLQAKVYNTYGSTEILDVACECSHGKMHLRTDSAVVEVEANQDGSGSHLIQTSLNNFAMPYLRYRNDDRGDLLEEDCDCGNHAPLMTFPLGRTFGNFSTPGGKIVHGQYFVKLMYDLVGVDQFQFHQVSLNRIILKAVKNAKFDAATAVRMDAALEQSKKMMGGDVEVKLEYMAEIPTTGRGKFLYTKSDVLK